MNNVRIIQKRTSDFVDLGRFFRRFGGLAAYFLFFSNLYRTSKSKELHLFILANYKETLARTPSKSYNFKNKSTLFALNFMPQYRREVSTANVGFFSGAGGSGQIDIE